MKITNQQLKQIIREELQFVLREFTGNKRTGQTGEQEAQYLNKEFKSLIDEYSAQGINYFNALQMATGKRLTGNTSPEILSNQNLIAHNLLMYSNDIINQLKHMGGGNFSGGPLFYDHSEFYQKGKKLFDQLYRAVEQNDRGALPPSARPLGGEDFAGKPQPPPYKKEATAVFNWLNELEKLLMNYGVTESKKSRRSRKTRG